MKRQGGSRKPVRRVGRGRHGLPMGRDNPVWQLLNETAPKFDGLKAQVITSLVEVVGMAERRLNRLIEAEARRRRSGLRVIPGGGKEP